MEYKLDKQIERALNRIEDSVPGFDWRIDPMHDIDGHLSSFIFLSIEKRLRTGANGKRKLKFSKSINVSTLESSDNAFEFLDNYTKMMVDRIYQCDLIK